MGVAVHWVNIVEMHDYMHYKLIRFTTILLPLLLQLTENRNTYECKITCIIYSHAHMYRCICNYAYVLTQAYYACTYYDCNSNLTFIERNSKNKLISGAPNAYRWNHCQLIQTSDSCKTVEGINRHIHIHIHANIHTHIVHIIYTYKRTYTRTYIEICIHTYIYIRIYTAWKFTWSQLWVDMRQILQAV